MSASSLGELLDRSAARYRDRPWLHFEDQVFSFREAAQRAEHAAAAFQRLGVVRGDRAVFIARNSADLIFAWLGLAKAAGVFVPLNPELPGPDLTATVNRAAARVVVVGDGIEKAHPTLAHDVDAPVVSLAEVAASRGSPRNLPRVQPDDVAVFINTSGTTGLSKLVMQTHRTYVLTGESFPWWLGLDEKDRLMTALPLFHLNAQAYSTIGSLTVGAGFIVLPRFSARRFWADATRYGATQANMIGAMIEILMRQPERASDGAHPVRLVYTAPALGEQRHRAIEDRFAIRLVVGYALSESPFGTIMPNDAVPRYASMGTPRQHPELGVINEVRIADESGADLDDGAIGEILLRNPGIMKGYFQMPAETDSALADGWLHTGDLARRDEAGYLYFVARKKDIIRRRGENLSPVEVEDVLRGHQDVQEVAVVGVPSALSDEDVKAFVVMVEGTGTDAAQLRAWCSELLAAFKLPRYIEFVDDLPLTPTGRVAKHTLPRERTAAEHDLEAGT